MCLDIVHKILALLKPDELKQIIGSVCSFVSHPSPACRERMYNILMWIQDNYRFPLFLTLLITLKSYLQFSFYTYFVMVCESCFYSDPESKADSICVEVLHTAKDTLLQGLTEENQDLQ